MTADPAIREDLSPGLAVEIDVDVAEWATLLPDLETRVSGVLGQAWAGAAGAGDLPDPAEVSVLLTDDARQKDLNARFRGKDTSTNVLSFPAYDPEDPPPPLGQAVPLGDISLALETTKAEAAALGLPFNDHFSHLLVHGLLHLLGYDHDAADEAERMESLEVEILARLGIADPYAEER